MYTNGIIIKRRNDSPYRGIDETGFDNGENWYLNDIMPEKFEEYYDEHIELTYYDLTDYEWAAVCTDMDYIRQYIEESEKLGIEYRLILCESDIPRPTMELPPCEKEFLGYDYTYVGGDYYSAVFSEVPAVFPQFRLNKNGLFETEEEIRSYLAAREEFVRTHPKLTLEVGNFAVFRLWEIRSL